MNESKLGTGFIYDSMPFIESAPDELAIMYIVSDNSGKEFIYAGNGPMDLFNYIKREFPDVKTSDINIGFKFRGIK